MFWRPAREADLQRCLGLHPGSLGGELVGERRAFEAWGRLLTQPSFESGAFHTTYLDGVLAARNGRPFVEPTPEIEDVAAIAAAIMAATAGDGMGADTSSSPWRTQARVEGLR